LRRQVARAHLVDRAPRERLVAGEHVAQGPAGQVVGGARAGRPARAQRGQAGEGIVFRDQQARSRGRGFRGGACEHHQRGCGRESPAHRAVPAFCAPTIARANASRAASYWSPVCAKETVSPASENTRGTIARSAASTAAFAPALRASVRYWWSCRPRRRFASWTLATGPARPRSWSGWTLSSPG